VNRAIGAGIVFVASAAFAEAPMSTLWQTNSG
jgi:hypothetical protein